MSGLTESEHRFKTLVCSHCGKPLRIQLNCGERTCGVCRRKWFGYHFKALQAVVEKWTAVYSLTLTIKNIPDPEFSVYDLRRIRDNFTRLRNKFKQISGGFYVVQATNRGKGWHLHLHIIFDGPRIDPDSLKRLEGSVSKAWEQITGDSFIVHLTDVGIPEKAIRYLLSDFSGEPRIRAEDFDIYNRIFAGRRLVQPFGLYRAVKLRVPFPCPDCGRVCWVDLESLLSQAPAWIEEDSS